MVLVIMRYFCIVMLSRKLALAFCLISLSFLSIAKDKSSGNPEKKKEEIQSKLSDHFTRAEAVFEINTGQYESEFSYRYGSPTANVDFYTEKVVFSLRRQTKNIDLSKPDGFAEFEYVSWEIDFNPSSISTLTHETEQLVKGVHYFKNNNGKSLNKTTTDRITYKDIFPHIDLVFYSNTDGALKYDFVLHPGAKLSDIKLNYTGVESMRILQDGTMSYSTKWGIVTEDKPVSFLQSNQSTVDISYRLDGNSLGFQADQDLITETTIIDPIYVDWSTYFYGTGSSTTGWAWTWVLDLDIDDSNNVYVTGMTSDRFPANTGAYDTSPGGYYDAFVCKMAPAGDSIIWFSYIGGSSYEYSFTLTVNGMEQPAIAGFSWSNDFPTTPGAFDRSGGAINYYKGFIAKFGKDGDSLIFSTFLGGSGSDLIHSMVLDAGGNLYITGETKSSDFPVTANCFQPTYGGAGSSSWWTGGDAFLTKMNPNGTSLLFSTYIGGALDDVAYEVALSPANEIYLVGKTSSGNFPVTAGSNIFNYNVQGTTDGFVMKFRTNGNTLVYSKLLGGSGADWFEGVYINDIDEAYIAGISESSNFYTTSKAYQRSSAGGADIVLVKMNRLGQNVIYSTYLGGGGDEKYYSGWIYNSNVSVSVNVREEPIICGISRSSNFPVTSDALMKVNPSSVTGGWWSSSAVIAKLDYLGEKLLYSTYFGGSSYEIPGANKLKRISCYTNILYGGVTASSDFPTTSGVYKEGKSSSGSGFFWTGFISKFRDTLYTDLIELSLSDTIYECDNVFEILDVKNQGADILWSNGSVQRYEIIRDTGTYWVQATYGCDTARDTIHFVLEYSPIVPVLPADSVYCDQFPSINLDAGNDSMLAVYNWSTGDTSKNITINSPSKYWVSIQTPHCGTKTDSVTYRLLMTPDVSLPPDSIFCDSIRLNLQSGLLNNDEIYWWNTGDSVNSLAINATGTYQLNAQNFCGEDSAMMQVSLLYTPVAQLPADTVFCDQAMFTVYANGLDSNQEVYLWADIDNSIILGLKDSLLINKTGLYSLQSTNRCGSDKDSIGVGLLLTPELNLGADSIYCDTIELQLIKGIANNAESYYWDNGSTLNSRTLNTAGTYWLRIQNKCATVVDSIKLTQKWSPIALISNASIGEVPDSVFCDAVSIKLDAAIADPEASYLWNTGVTTASINANASGLYTVKVKNYCGEDIDDVNFALLSSPTVELGPEKVFCGSVVPFNVSVGTENNNELYLWSTGDVDGEANIQTAGKYWVQISNKCARVSDTAVVRISPYPIVQLPEDTSLCGNFELILDAANPGMSYLWEPYGETSQTIKANEQRVYTVHVTNSDGCTTTDRMEITGDCISHYYFPNAFRPDGDGRNDEFKPSLVNFERYEMSIYNRWGELLFRTNDANDGWDGKYKGTDVQQGVYLYVITFVATEDLKHHNFSGIVNLLR